MLRKSFDSSYKRRAEFLQLAGAPSDPGYTTYKLYTDPRRGAFISIISPILLSNTRSWDDKKTLKIFYPTQNEVVEQPSPNVFRMASDKRIKLVERNYTLSIKDEGMLVADRKVYVIHLKAKNAVVGDRILYIDREHFTVLRSILKESPTKYFTLLETKVANFQVEWKPDQFRIPSVSTRKKWGPVNLQNFPKANESLGFAPRIPATLPYGFEITHRQVVGNKDKPIFACRLSDGMTSVTVYQWNPKKFDGESPFQGVRSVSDQYGIRYYAEGDAPRPVLDEVRRTFALR